jgi:hypothetical protein
MGSLSLYTTTVRALQLKLFDNMAAWALVLIVAILATSHAAVPYLVPPTNVDPAPYAEWAHHVSVWRDFWLISVDVHYALISRSTGSGWRTAAPASRT